MTPDEWGTLAEIFQALVSLGILVITTWAARVALKRLRTSVAQTRISGTTDLFDRFNHSSALDTRRWVYHNCRKLVDPDQVSQWAKDLEDLNLLESICNSLDLAAYLVHKGLVDIDDAIELYGHSVIRCWVVLRPWVEHTRLRRESDESLWRHFEWLADQAIACERFLHWRKNGVAIYTASETVTFDYDTSQIRRADPIA
jgi:hypothetical protein